MEHVRSRFRIAMWITLAAVLSGAQSAAAANGDLDPSFSEDGLVRLETPDASESAASVVPLANGGALVAGTRSIGALMNESYRAGVVLRIRADGSVDSTYGEQGESIIPATPGLELADIETLPDGGAVVVGVRATGTSFAPFDGVVARLTPTGRLDPTFAGDGVLAEGELPAFNSVAVDSDGRILAAGAAPGSRTAVSVMRLTEDGRPDSTYGENGIATVEVGGIASAFMPPVPLTDLEVDSDGRALVSTGARGAAVVTRLRPDGTTDPTFGVGGQARLLVVPDVDFGVSIALRPDGRIVLVTDEQTGPYAEPRANFAYQLEPNGEVDHSYTTRLGQLDGSDAVLAPSGHLVVAGMWRTDGADSGDFGVAVLEPRGGPAEDFGDGGMRQVRFDLEIDEAASLSLDSAGRILLAGRAGYRFPVTSDFGLARLETTDGPPDADGDGLPDPGDGCETRFGPRRSDGCPIETRRLSLATSGHSLRGQIRSESTFCASSGRIRLWRTREGADRPLGRVNRLPLIGEPDRFGRRFELSGSSPRSLRDVYVRVRPARDPEEGRCRGARANLRKPGPAEGADARAEVWEENPQVSNDLD